MPNKVYLKPYDRHYLLTLILWRPTDAIELPTNDVDPGFRRLKSYFAICSKHSDTRILPDELHTSCLQLVNERVQEVGNQQAKAGLDPDILADLELELRYLKQLQAQLAKEAVMPTVTRQSVSYAEQPGA